MITEDQAREKGPRRGAQASWRTKGRAANSWYAKGLRANLLYLVGYALGILPPTAPLRLVLPVTGCYRPSVTYSNECYLSTHPLPLA